MGSWQLPRAVSSDPLLTMKERSLEQTSQDILLEPFRKELSRCVKCGACRAVCPSFLAQREESLSARGRMALVSGVLEGRLSASGIYRDRLSTCMSCLACEAACPSGVPVTEIVQAAKEQALREAGAGIIDTIVAGFVKHPAAFRAAAWLAPAALHYTRGQGARDRGRKERSVSGVQSLKKQRSKGTIAFFPGCAVEYFQPDIEQATISILNAMGYDTIIPEGLMCCGRPLLSLGDVRGARGLAEQNNALLADLAVDAVVTACASCGLTFKREYPKLLRPGAKRPVVLDIHEFLSGRISEVPLGPVNTTVTWHDPCHLGRGQGLSETAREVLRSVPGLTLVEMKNAGRCCGFGGVMRISRRGLSDAVAADKVKSIVATGASLVVTGCPGCRMQIADALTRKSSDIKVMHTVQLLAAALTDAERQTAGKKNRGLQPA